MLNKERIQFMCMVGAAIFASKAAGTEITQVAITHPAIAIAGNKAYGRWFVGGMLRGFDVPVLDNGTVKPLRILEQNPNKDITPGHYTDFALAARAGKKIAWVIRRDFDPPNQYIGHMENKLTNGIETWEWFPQSDRRPVKTVRGPIPGTFQRVAAPAPLEFSRMPINEEDPLGWAHLPEVNIEDISSLVESDQW